MKAKTEPSGWTSPSVAMATAWPCTRTSNSVGVAAVQGPGQGGEDEAALAGRTPVLSPTAAQELQAGGHSAEGY